MKLNKLITIAGLGLTALAANASTDAIVGSLIITQGSASGNLNSLRFADNHNFRISATIGRRFSWQVLAGVHMPPAQVQTMTIRLRGKKASIAPIIFSLFNARTNLWQVIGPVSLPSSGTGTSTFTIPSDAGRFVRPGGAVRVRYEGFGPASMTVDQLQISVN